MRTSTIRVTSAHSWCLDCHRNPEANIVGARPISGVFTGQMHKVNDLMDSSYLYKPIAAQVAAKSELRDIVTPSYGQKESPLPKYHVDGIPHPKKAGTGPENCSACHY